jgi:uncharacterized protein YjbI with pentapeptide repeats
MKFDIRNRFTGAVQFTAEIDCADDVPTSIKIGLAVKWALENRASLAGARLDRASLVGASLDGASLDGASLVGARLDRASLDRASLDGASLAGASLDGASLVGARLDRARLYRASLAGARLDGASLVGARLDRARLDRASLAGASLAGASLDGAKIKRLAGRATRSDGYEFFGWLLDDDRRLIRAGCQTMTLDNYRARAADYGDTVKTAETVRILDYLDACFEAAEVAP